MNKTHLLVRPVARSTFARPACQTRALYGNGARRVHQDAVTETMSEVTCKRCQTSREYRLAAAK